MKRAFIGIPILNRFDLLAKALDSFDYPADVVIINNNSVDCTFIRQLDGLAKSKGFRILHQKRNLGVAASWNLIISAALSEGYEWVFIGSNDTFLHRGSLRAAVDLPKEREFAVWHLHAFNFFLVNVSSIERVGWFDENFYPAYKEDQDYCYRCQLAGARRTNVPGCAADHVGSATIHSDPNYAARNDDTHGLNALYYGEKWGGDAGAETFRNPYNDPSRDHKFWRAPRAEIRSRDWDQPRPRT